MSETESDSFIIEQDDLVLVTGTSGFIGSRLVECLLDRGFRNLRCFARPSSEMGGIEALSRRFVMWRELKWSKATFCRARIAPPR